MRSVRLQFHISQECRQEEPTSLSFVEKHRIFAEPTQAGGPREIAQALLRDRMSVPSVRVKLDSRS